MSKKSDTNKSKSRGRHPKSLSAEPPGVNRTAKTHAKIKSASEVNAGLLAEIEELRSRLAEAEDTLRAIRSGEVDALLVSKPGGDQVFTLKGAEHRYRVLVEEMNDGAVTLNREGTILFCNRSLASMLQMPLEKIIGSSLRHYVADESLPSFEQFINRTFYESGKLEVVLQKENGSVFPVLLSGRKLSLDDGGISVVVTDISLQKVAEETLRRGRDELEKKVQERTSELKFHKDELEIQNEELRAAQEELETSRAKYADLYNLAPVGYFTLDKNALIQEVNLAGAKMLGINKQALLNAPFSMFVADPEHKKIFSEHRKSTSTKDGRQTCEIGLRRSDGVIFYAFLESVAAENISGRAGCIRTAVTDITERKRMETALKDSEEKYRTLFENMTSSFALSEIIVDGEGKARDYRYLEVNKTYEQLSGVKRDKILSKTAREHNPLLGPEWLEKFSAVARSGESLRFEHYLGHIGKWLEVYSYSPKRGLFACVINDITARKRAEEAIQSMALFPQQNPAPVLRISRDGVLLFSNQSAKPLLMEWRPGEKQNVPDFVKKTVEAAIDEGVIRGLEVRLGDRDISFVVTPISNFNYANLYGSDITARKRAEKKIDELNQVLQRRISELETIFNTVPIGLAIADDPEGRHIRGNPANERLVGVPEGGELSKGGPEPARFSVLQDGRELRVEDLPMQRAVRGEVVTGQVIDVIREDGRIVTLHSSATPLFDEQGRLRGAVGAFQDITELKRAEAAIRQSNRLLDAVVNSTHLLMACLDGNFNFIWVNRAYAEADEKKPEFFPGRNHFALYPNEENEAIFRNVVETGKPFFIQAKPFEYKDHPERGVTYWDWGLVPLVDERTGNVERLVFTLLNITERKQVEERISHQNAILKGIKKIFESALTCDTEEELGRACLEVAEEVTGSKFGFIGHLGADGFLHDISISDPGWELCTMYDKTGHRRLPNNFKVHGLYGRVVMDGKCFFTNDPASHPDSIGLPEGHPPLTAFLAAPLIQMGKTIGMVGLGNREGGYRTEDSEALDALAVVIVQVFLRMRAEEALRKNQERLREYVNLLEYAPLMVRNMKEEIILWNRGMQRMYGYSSAEAIGQNSHHLLKTRFPQPFEEIVRAVETTGKWEGEMKHVTRDGRTIIVTSIWVLHKDSEGKATAIIEVNSDITERRRAEEQLQKLNEELEARVRERTFDLARTITTLQNEIVDRRQAEEALRESQFNLSKAQSIAHIGSWSYDLKTEKFVSSAEFYNIFGLKPDHKANLRTIVNIVHPDDREKVRASIRELMSNSMVKPLDYRIILPDGTPRVVWTEAEMLFDAAHRPVSIVGTVHDITERKRAEEELIRLATAVESAADAIVVTDPVNGIIQYVNPAFEKITGYAREEVLGSDLHMLESGTQDEEFFQKLRETLRKDGVWTGRIMHKKKDGTLYEEECTYSPVKNASGDIINYISIKRDVTEKVRLESIAQAVETMNNIGYIFAGVSHEIGNPVNAIRMTLDMMQKKMEVMSKENITEYLYRVKSQIFRIEYLLKGLKNFNMYESLQPGIIDMPSFLDAFLAMVKKDFEAKGVLIETVLQQDAACLYADPRALQQVLLNILTNASDALEGRKDPKIVIAISASSGLVKIQVKDNGRGIEESQLKDLFKPFYTTKNHGTGLGLVIIKKMIARMNGTVEITSRFNEGTVVELCLPCEKVETND